MEEQNKIKSLTGKIIRICGIKHYSYGFKLRQFAIKSKTKTYAFTLKTNDIYKTDDYREGDEVSVSFFTDTTYSNGFYHINFYVKSMKMIEKGPKWESEENQKKLLSQYQRSKRSLYDK